jgi:HSP20 family protein
MTRNEIMKRSDNKPLSTFSHYERRVIPPTDIIETGSVYTVRVDMPGVNKESIKIKVDGDMLRVTGSTGNYHDNDPKMLVREIAPKVYEREFQLGNEIDRSKISGEYDMGVLTITCPKAEEAIPKAIDVKVK